MNADEKRLMMRLLQREYINDIPEEEKVCACGCRLKRVGENSKKRLRIIISKCMQLTCISKICISEWKHYKAWTC